MKLISTNIAWEDYEYWISRDNRMVKRIQQLLKEIGENPYDGSGCPLPLKFDHPGLWSRKIFREHRLVYKVEGENIYILSCRFHND